MSACNTGRGRITGDGVIGLSRSFIAAGIPSVIVSLWSVPDAPTAELMTEFYTNLYQKKLDKAQALRMAMLKIMEKHLEDVPSFLEEAINQIEDESVLKMLLRQAITIGSLEEFQQEIARLTSVQEKEEEI